MATPTHAPALPELDSPTAAIPRPSPLSNAAAAPGVVTVCHPVYRLEAGGLEHQLLQTAARLPHDRFRHIIVARSWDEETALPTGSLGPNSILVKEQRPEKDPQWPYRLAAILRDHAVDVLHIRGLTMLMDSFMAAQLCGDIRIAFSFHGLEEASRQIGSIRRGILQAAIARCDVRWAVSRRAAQTLADMLKMSSEEFTVLSNGVDVERFVPADNKQEIRSLLGLPPEGPILLSVGNLKPIKGHDVLLDAARRLSAEAPRFTLVLVGQDYLDGNLHQWAKKYLAHEDIRFVGHQPDVLPWYQAADLFVLPSLWEGHCNALLEAMSCGLPVVATDVGGNSETVIQDTTGRLVPLGDAAALAHTLSHLLNTPSQRVSFGQAARQHAVNHFDMAASIERYGACYRDLAGRTSRGGEKPH